MSYIRVVKTIDELRLLVESWNSGGEPSAIEMDLALERVKSIYEMLRFPSAEEEQVEEQVEEEIPAVESVIITEPELEPAPAPVEEPLLEEVEKQPSEDDRLESELIAVISGNNRKNLNQILSLYESESACEYVEESESITEVVKEEMQTESIDSEGVISEVCESQGADTELPTLNSLLSINDRILLLQELFDGDSQQLITTLSRLDAEPSIDDAMIYIAENYSWSGDNEGAKLLMSLLENRYQN